MSGHVFHPGHHELHGITVVLRTTDEQIMVGRFDTQDAGGVQLIGVSTFNPERDGSAAEFLTRTGKFGIRVDRSHAVISSSIVASITPLNQELGAK